MDLDPEPERKTKLLDTLKISYLDLSRFFLTWINATMTFSIKFPQICDKIVRIRNYGSGSGRHLITTVIIVTVLFKSVLSTG
jgi:hypothetical protein